MPNLGKQLGARYSPYGGRREDYTPSSQPRKILSEAVSVLPHLNHSAFFFPSVRERGKCFHHSPNGRHTKPQLHEVRTRH